MQLLLKNSKYTQVNQEDYDYLRQWTWNQDKFGYVYRASSGKRIMMHYQLVPRIQGLQIDHINLDKLDNRRTNFRYATPSQNKQNSPTSARKYGLPRGVTFDRDTRRYQIQIRTDRNKRLYLGQYRTVEEASSLYNCMAAIFHGEFATLGEVG